MKSEIIPADRVMVGKPWRGRAFSILIEWETKKTLHFKPAENACYLGEAFASYYRFHQNYYFMGGDQAENSEDSRYWGLVPEAFIVGRVGWISASHDPSTGRLRRERGMKRMK